MLCALQFVLRHGITEYILRAALEQANLSDDTMRRYMTFLMIFLAGTVGHAAGREGTRAAIGAASAMQLELPSLLVPTGAQPKLRSLGQIGDSMSLADKSPKSLEPSQIDCIPADRPIRGEQKANDPTDQEAPALQRDLQRLYPFFRPSCGFFGARYFRESRWVFLPAAKGQTGGIFAFVAPPIPGIATSTAVLSGRWQQRGDIVIFHARNFSGETTFSLDGVLRRTDSTYEYTSLLAVTARGASDVAEVSGALRQSEAAFNKAFMTLLSADIRSTIDKIAQGEFKEPAKLSGTTREKGPDGLYDGTVSSDAEGLGPVALPVLVAVRTDDRGGPALAIVPVGAFRPGRLTLDDPGRGMTRLRVSLAAGHLRAELTSGPGSLADSPLTWTVPSKGAGPEKVIGQTASIDLRLRDGRLSGTLEAVGTTLAADPRRLTYKAIVTAALQATPITDGLRKSLGSDSLEGTWDTGRPEVSQITLSRTGSDKSDNLGGTYSDLSAGLLSGDAAGSVGDMRWEDKTGRGSGTLLVRLLPDGGHLAGLWWRDDATVAAFSFVATQRLPAIDLTTASGADLIASASLAGDFALQGRLMQSTTIYRALYRAYIAAADRATHSSDQQFLMEQGYLVSASLKLNRLINDDFRLGSYLTLLQDLKRAVTLQRRLSPDNYIVRLVGPRVEQFNHIKTAWGTTIDFLVGQAAAQSALLDAAGIGVGLAVVPDGISIAQVTPGKPAAEAGVRVGDRLEAIDGLPAGSDPAATSSKLRGPDGSRVVLKIKRNGTSQTITLLRRRLFPMTGEMRQTIAGAISTLSSSLVTVRTILDTEIPQVDDRAGVGEALRRLGSAAHSIDVEAERVFSLDPSTYLGSSGVVAEMRKMRTTMQAMSEGGRPDPSQMGKLEAKLEAELKGNAASDLSAPQRQLALLQYKSYGLLALISSEININLRSALEMASSDNLTRYKIIYNGIAISFNSEIENWRARLRADDARIAALDAGTDFFDSLVQLLVDVGEPKLALVASEQARARAFQDLLATRMTKTGYQTAGAGSTGGITTAKSITLDQWNDLVRHRGAAVLEYYVGRDKVLVWSSTPGKQPRLTELTVRPDALIARSTELTRLLQSEASGPNPAVWTLLGQLYQDLIAPLPPDALPAAEDDEVIIVPHRQLGLVPFGALHDQDEKLLIEKHALSYAQSIGEFRFYGDPPRDAGQRRLLALVDPAPLPDALPPLQVSKSIIDDIAKKYPAGGSTIHSGAGASVDTLERDVASATSVLLLTHAIADADDPTRSFVALAATRTSDGKLYPAAISRLPLRADLVVLGACSTGRGRASADGINGLSRGFATAGARSIIMTLWDARLSMATVEIAYFFNWWLSNHATKAAALRHAQLGVLEYAEKLRRQPQAWAAFVLYGDGR